MYKISFATGFDKSFQATIKKDKILIKKFFKTIRLLEENPFYPSLKSHKVDIISFENVWVSSVSGDVRLAWVFDSDNQTIIICLQLGTHSGSTQIYKNKSS